MSYTIAIIAAIRQYIINSCIEAAGGQLFPCVKQSVYAVVITADGKEYFGANWMTSSDVTICPRILANTTSYELCATVCGQGTEFHAERQAMWSALYDDADLTGAEVFITGHTYCCDTCRAAMFEEGITYAASLDSGKYYMRGEETMREITRCKECGLKQCACDDVEAYLAELDNSDEIIFNTPVYSWKKTPAYPEFIAYKNGQTSIIDLWHKDGVVYRTHKKQRHTYNIYLEPTFVYDLVDIAVGFTYDNDTKCTYYGAYTAIEWVQNVLPAPPEEIFFASDLDELF